MLRSALVVAAVALALGGCRSLDTVSTSPTGSLPPDFGRHSRADVLARLAAADTLSGVSGEATLVVQSPQQSGTYDASVQAAADGRALLTVSMFGVTGGRVLVRPDSAFVHNVIRRELLATDARRAAEVLPIPLAPSDLFDALTGTLRPADVATFTLSTDERNGLYLLRSPDGQRVVSVDPRVWRVVRAVRYETAGGGVAEEVLWANYAASGRALLPRRVTVRQPSTNTQVVLLLSSVAPTATPSIPAKLTVPSGTTRSEL